MPFAPATKSPASLTEEFDLPAGRLFGPYEILEPIGAGGMGVVFRARQRDLNRIVALKLIRTGALASPAEIRRFRREAMTAGRLQHPNIVQVHEVGEWDGRHFFSMEFVEGQSLARLLQTQPLPADRAAACLEAVARATHAAHLEGVIHRDLKPDNILIDRTQQPRLTDFGIARSIHADGTGTLPGSVLGTPSYMAPEQACGSLERIAPASDVYSLGAVLYEALTGRPPFRADSVLETLRQVLEEEPASPRSLNRTVPRDLEVICLKCLAKEPQARYPTAEDFAEDLRRYQNREPIRARPVSALERAWRWANRNPSAAISGSVAFILLALLALTGLRAHFIALDELREDAQKFASDVRDFMDELGGAVRTVSLTPGFGDAAGNRDLPAITNILQDLVRSAGTETFENWVVMDPRGWTLARVPPPIREAIPDRSSRDYFAGAVAHATQSGRLHFSKAYHSVEDDLFKVGISAPLIDGTGRWVGIVTGMVNTQSSTNRLAFESRRRQFAVIAQGDTRPVVVGDQTNVAPNLLVFLHHAFGPKHRGIPIEHPQIHRLLERSDLTHVTDSDLFFRDPMRHLDPKYDGFWLAAMVRVKDTPFVVITQRRNPLPEVAFAMAWVIAPPTLCLLIYLLRRHKRSRFR